MTRVTIGEYLLNRLAELGVGHVFGLPGDYNLGFLDQVMAHPDIAWIGTCNELNAAYAADGYGRIQGLAALATTFGVGELSAINGIAGAFAEYVPVVAITGAPATATQGTGALVHHTLGTGDFTVFGRMYERVTAAQAYLTTENAAAEIDRVLTVCLMRKQPVYISLPADVASAGVPAPAVPLTRPSYRSDPSALAEAIEASVEMLEAAQNPAILADVGVDRYRLHGAFRSLLEATGYPYATMTMGKGLLEETHPQFIGLYGGALGDPVRAPADRRRRLRPDDRRADDRLQHRRLLGNPRSRPLDRDPRLLPEDQARPLRGGGDARRPAGAGGAAAAAPPTSLDLRPASARLDPGFNRPFVVDADMPITQRRFWHRLSGFLEEGDIVLAEAGTALFGAAEMPLPAGATFICQLLWASIGYTLGALLGTGFAAAERRSILVIGDGALQLTAQELSTMLRHGLTPVIFVINNDGYTVERVIHGAEQAYNDVQPWSYHRLTDVLGGQSGLGVRVTTEGELEAALAHAAQVRDRLVLIEVVMDRMDCPDLLRKLGRAAAAMNKYVA